MTIMPNDTKNKMEVPVNEPVISEEAKRNVAEALATGWLSSAGPFVTRFEENFATFLGVKHAVAVSSGTAALHVALLALGIGAGDEVIVPAFSMGACFLSVLHAGAKPVFVDCEPETYNIDTNKIEEKITPKTKAIMAVHTYGHACDMDVIRTVAKKHKLFVIEDAAEAHGATYKGKKCGSLGDVGCFSFYANKIITTGEGGMIVTNNPSLAHEAAKLKDLYHSDKKRFIHEKVGYNYRLTNLQAAVGLGELEHIDEYLEKKVAMAKRYSEALKKIPGIKIPTTLAGIKNVFWVYAVLIDPKKFSVNRDTFKKLLQDEGIGTRDFFYPPEEQPVLKNIIGKETFPNAAYAGHTGLYLPSGLAITEAQIDYVIEKIKSIAQANPKA